VGSARVGSSYKTPSRRAPQVGKVSEDSLKAQSEVASHVFQHDSIGSYCANGVPDVGPKVSLIIGAFPVACSAEWLAGVSTCDDVHRGHVTPVDFGYVPQVGDARVVGLHDFARGWLHLGVPGEFATHGQV